MLVFELYISRIVFRTAHIFRRVLCSSSASSSRFVTISHSGNLTDRTGQQEKLFPEFYFRKMNLLLTACGVISLFCLSVALPTPARGN